MNLTDATKILDANTPAAAGARTIIQRSLRKMKLPTNDNVENLAGHFLAHPWSCTAAIERTLAKSAKAYECDDGQRERLLAHHVECLMSLIDFKLDWPGLYPTYEYTEPKPEKMPPGLFCETHYDLGQVWRFLKDVRKYN